MSLKLIIIGAGNVGGFISYNIKQFGNYEVIGFLDDDPTKIGKTLFGRTVLGAIDDIEKFVSDNDLHVVIGISSPRAKKSIIDHISRYQVHFPNFISRNVWLSENVAVGKGNIIYPGVSINYGVKVGDFVIMNMNCAIGHDCLIGDFVSLAPGVNFAGFTHVEEGASIGIGVSTRQNVRIGQFATIGGQCMLVKDTPARALVTGVPGRIVSQES